MSLHQRTIAVCALLGSIVFSFLPSCSAKRVQLEIWDWHGARYELWKAKIPEYEKLNPNISIKPSLTDWDTYWNKIATSISANTAPDIFAFHNGWTGKFLNLIEPYPEKLFPLSNMKSEFILFNAAFVFSNKFFFYPQGLNTSLMFYNKNLFAEVGLASTPKTWADFRLAAKKLTKMTSQNQFSRVGFDLNTWQAGLMWTDLRYQSGKWLYSEDGKRVEWDDDSGMKATSLLYDMSVRDRNTPVPGREALLAFESGKVGISYQWAHMKSVYQKSTVKYDTFIIPTPDGQGSPARARNNIVAGFAVTKGKTKTKRDAAFAFLKWLYSDDTFFMKLNDVMGTLPARKALWTRAQIKSDLVQHNVALQAPYTVFPGEFPSWMYNEVLPEMCSRMMQSKLSPEQAIKWATATSNARLKSLPLKWVVERKYRPGEGL